MQQTQAAPDSTPLRTQTALWFLLAYLALYGALAHEWLGHAYDRLPRDLFSDGWLIYWILDWVGDTLLSAPAQIFSPPINWPATNQLAGSEHFGTFQAFYLPLRTLLGSELAALNFTIFSAYALASWITALVLARLGCSPLVGLGRGASLRADRCLVSGEHRDRSKKLKQALPHIMQIAHLFIPWIILGLISPS